MIRWLELQDRSVIAVGGADRVTLLQGLVSNDVTKAGADRALYAALLTAQGRFLHDMFIVARGETLLLDCEAARRDDLLRRLKLYRLRAKVTLDPLDDAVMAIWGDGAGAAFDLGGEPGTMREKFGGEVFVDPRHAALGLRAIVPRAAMDEITRGHAAGSRDVYDRARIALAVPDGSRDLPVEQALLLENNFDALHGVDWKKGCYIGQELTARMKYRALVKKRLMPVKITGPVPAPGTMIMSEGAEAGEMRGASGDVGLALLRIETVENRAPLMAGSARIEPIRA